MLEDFVNIQFPLDNIGFYEWKVEISFFIIIFDKIHQYKIYLSAD